MNFPESQTLHNSLSFLNYSASEGTIWFYKWKLFHASMKFHTKDFKQCERRKKNTKEMKWNEWEKMSFVMKRFLKPFMSWKTDCFIALFCHPVICVRYSMKEESTIKSSCDFQRNITIGRKDFVFHPCISWWWRNNDDNENDFIALWHSDFIHFSTQF